MTLKYAWNKVKTFLPTYIIMVLVNAWIMLWMGEISFGSLLSELVKTPFNFFYLILGTKSNIYNPNEWYLSALLLCSFVIYPLLINKNKEITKYIMFVLCIIGFGYTYIKFGKIANNDAAWVVRPMLIRGYSEMVVGVGVWEIVNRMRRKAVRKSILLTIIKWISYLVFILNAYVYQTEQFDIYAFTFLAVGITISFSGLSYNIASNGMTRFCARILLTLYLMQYNIQQIIDYKYGTVVTIDEYLLVIVITFILAVVVLGLSEWVKKFGKYICVRANDKIYVLNENYTK